MVFRELLSPTNSAIPKRGELLLNGYQTGGGSKKGSIPAWRFFTLAKIRDLVDSNADFQVRERYRPGPNKIIVSVICEV